MFGEMWSTASTGIRSPFHDTTYASPLPNAFALLLLMHVPVRNSKRFYALQVIRVQF